MRVSAIEVAKAAVEFGRQGLPEDKVTERLTSTIHYAKISAMAFEEAAELITAATNTMDVSAKQAADLFAYLGDESASGADEVGIAMQRASASAQEFGVTFEWLGAYIATVSEKTRQAPEVIGTSINSIMARLHSIKEKGFNEEDSTRINDVAKALATVNVALLDEQDNWRDMSDIFIVVAENWDTLNGKQRSYLATAIAGTRQQNAFLALMNDMAKGIEGGSRAFELYEGALNAAGTAAQKYAVWQESVAAAQGRLDWFENLGLSAQEGTAIALDKLDEAWSIFEDHLSSFAAGLQYNAMNPYFREQMDVFFAGVVDGIDRQADITEEAMTAYAMRIKSRQDELYAIFMDDPTLVALLDQRESMLGALNEASLDAYNDLVGRINEMLEAKNSLIPSDDEKLSLLPVITPEDLSRIQQAEADLIKLSDALSDVFAKLAKEKETKKADENLYVDQIAALRKAWESDQTGAAFIRTLNEMQIANDDLVSGMLKTHEGLSDLVDTVVTGKLEEGAENLNAYSDGLAKLSDMERIATVRAQERTAEMLKEMSAAKLLEQAEKDHFQSILETLRDALETFGYDAFIKMWDDLGDSARQAIADLYPEIATLATVMGETADGASAFAEALEKAAGMNFSMFAKTLGEDMLKQRKIEAIGMLISWRIIMKFCHILAIFVVKLLTKSIGLDKMKTRRKKQEGSCNFFPAPDRLFQ